MALLTVTDIGEELVWVDCDAGADGYDEFPNDGRCTIMIINGSGETRTAKLIAQDAVNCPADELHDSDVDHPLSMDAGEYGTLEPAVISRARFNNRTTGRATIKYSDEADMQVSVHRVI